MFRCVSDTWDNNGSTYANVEEFVRMCAFCFHEAPTLTERVDGAWYDDDTGERVLVSAFPE